MGLPHTMRLVTGDLGRAGGVTRVRQSSGPVTVQILATGWSPRAGGADRIRIGFAIGKAVGGAVVRNGLRRRLRPALRALLTTTPPHSPDGVTLVVVRLSPEAAETAGGELTRHLERAVKRGLDLAAVRGRAAGPGTTTVDGERP